ncbi:RDD family protein [Streptomyces globosus]
MTASPGDGEHAAREGYYPDPSIPGYVRYWNGRSWVPGTARPAGPGDPVGPRRPRPEPEPEPEPVRDAAGEREADPAGPDAPGDSREPGDSAAPAWQADPQHQAGFGGPHDHVVSWGSPADGPEPEAGHAPARRTGASLGRGPHPEPPDDRGPAGSAERGPGVSFARTPAAAAAPAPAARAPEGIGILSARSPAAAAAPAATAWPSVPGGTAGSGLTSSWPEASVRSEPAPDPAPPAPRREDPPAAAEAPRRESRAALPETAPSAPPRARRPLDDEAPRPAAAPAPAAARRPAPERRTRWEDRAAVDAAPSAAPSAPAAEVRPTARAVFEEMAERAVRPAGLVRRAAARTLDTLVLAAVAAAAARPLLPAVTAHLQAKVDAARGAEEATTVWLFDATIAGYLGVVLAVLVAFGLCYEVLPTARWGRTPGKKLCGVRVLSSATFRPPGFGAALSRWLVGAFLGPVGWLWCLGDRPRRRAAHDRAAGTYAAR